MLKKYVVLMLSVLVISLFLSSVTVIAETKEEKAAKRAEKVKINVAKLGTGPDAKVEVKLKDGTKIKGYVSDIKEDSFGVVSSQTTASVNVPYNEVKQIKGNNLSTGVKIAIVVGVILLIGLIAGLCCAQ